MDKSKFWVGKKKWAVEINATIVDETEEEEKKKGKGRGNGG